MNDGLAQESRVFRLRLSVCVCQTARPEEERKPCLHGPVRPTRTHAQAGESAEADVTGPAGRSTGRPPGILCDIHEVPTPSFQRSVHSTPPPLCSQFESARASLSVGPRHYHLPLHYIHGLRLCKPASSGHCSPTTSVEYRPPPVVGRWWAHLICMLAVAGPAGTRLHAPAAVAAFVHDATSDRPRHVPVHHGTRAPWELCTSDCPYFWAVPCCANSWP
jgi:hypothetical protein